MGWWRFDALWQDDRWLSPAFVEVSPVGKVMRVTDEQPYGTAVDHDVAGIAIPGFPNAHSHAFQYLMAGRAEAVAKDRPTKNFWSWRQRMYELAQKMTPDIYRDVATLVFSEMLQEGYTCVAEFHYLHHGHKGLRYHDLGAMGRALIEAAGLAGIHLCLIPVFYRNGDFGQPPASEQLPFCFRSIDEYFALMQAYAEVISEQANVSLAYGVHSLRAADPKDVQFIFDRAHSERLPCHIHIAEQKKEVVSCTAHLGSTPVQWLLDHVDLGPLDQLIHATHMTGMEIERLAKSGASVVLCPSTEGNLADGIFAMQEYLSHGGKWCIGSDSQVGLNPFEELRWLDYIQRLSHLERQPLKDQHFQDMGEHLFNSAFTAGQGACNVSSSSQSFNVMVFDSSNPIFTGRPHAEYLPSLIYGGGRKRLLGTITNGSWVIQNGKHVREDLIISRYKLSMSKLIC